MKQRCSLLALASVIIVASAVAQTPHTVGMILHTASSTDSGYVLFAPMMGTTTYLIDKCGKEIHTWPSTYRPNYSVYLLDDGSILRPGLQSVMTSQGSQTLTATERIAWDGSLLWQYHIPDTTLMQNHDVARLPNGNVLINCWKIHSFQETFALGRDSARFKSPIWTAVILEVRPVGLNGGEIVWRWDADDHLVQDVNPGEANYGVVADHPELLNVNYVGNSSDYSDWLHMNAVTYNAATDQIMMSSHNMCELYVIDHSTSTAEAASHKGGEFGRGGDILYRWGNPAAYNHGTVADQRLYGQHNTQWIPEGCPNAGKILIYNNGLQRPDGPYSTVEIITPPSDSTGHFDSALPYQPRVSNWVYADSPRQAFYSAFISGAQMLPNGHVLICSGERGIMFEVDSAGTKSWKYVNPVTDSGPLRQGRSPMRNSVFRCTFYPFSHPAFTDEHLSTGQPIETGSGDYPCLLNLGTPSEVAASAEQPESPVFVYPNPASDHIFISDEDAIRGIVVYDAFGQKVMEVKGAKRIDLSTIPAGIYVILVNGKARSAARTISVVK